MINQRKRTYPMLVMLISLIITGNLFAQRQGPPALPDSAQIVKIVDELAEALTLTEEQKSAITDLHFTHFADAKELMEANKGDRESNRQAMEDLRKDFDNQIKELLNDDQIAKYEAYIKNRNPGKQQRPGRR
ncbi:MAG: hypothetical protein AB7T22_10165 [Calditrichaceae bacterium]